MTSFNIFCWKNVLILIKHSLQHATNVKACSRLFYLLYCKDQSELRAQSSIREPRAIHKWRRWTKVTKMTCFQQCYMRIRHCSKRSYNNVGSCSSRNVSTCSRGFLHCASHDVCCACSEYPKPGYLYYMWRQWPLHHGNEVKIVYLFQNG